MQDLRCNVPEHNKKKFVSITLQNQAEKRLFCFQCQSDASAGDLSKSQLVGKLKLCDLDEVMEGNPYSVYNWPADDEGVKVKELLVGFKSLDQQKKEVEDFFLQMKGKLIEQVENVKQLLVELLNATQFFKDEKLKQEDEKKDAKQDDKKETKKDDKKETKKHDKKDTKKDDKKDDKKEAKKEGIWLNNGRGEIENDPNLLSAKINEYLNDQRRYDIQISLKNVYQGVQVERLDDFRYIQINMFQIVIQNKFITQYYLGLKNFVDCNGI